MSQPINPYQPASPMTSEQKALIEAENKARFLFANEPDNPQLADPHLLLVNVFASPPGHFDYSQETPEEKRVPKLLTHQRQLDLQGSSTVDKATFLKNWEEFTQGCLNGLDFTNVFVAGGAVLGCLSSTQEGYRSSDIDLFLYGITDEEQANQKVRSIYRQVVSNTKGKGDVIRTGRALTILCAYPYRHIQIILRLYRSPAEVLLGFDIDSCCVGFDGTDVWCQERFRRALTKRYNLVNISRRSLTYESRLFKYSKRGFAVAVPDLDKARINTELFQKEVRDVGGLAKLILFDYKQGAGKSVFSRVPRSQKQLLNEGSDYNNDLPIPWGPEWQTDVIINLLHAKNKANFFSSLRKNKQGNEPSEKAKGNYNHMFTSDASQLAQSFSNWKRSIDGQVISKPLEWIRDNPAYQDYDNGFQRLMTGSFEPVVDKNWETGAYLPDGQRLPNNVLASKPFSTDESSIKDSNHSPSSQHRSLPFQPAKLPKQAKFSKKPQFKPKPAKAPSPKIAPLPTKKAIKFPAKKASSFATTAWNDISSSGFGAVPAPVPTQPAGFGSTGMSFGGGLPSKPTTSFGTAAPSFGTAAPSFGTAAPSFGAPAVTKTATPAFGFGDASPKKSVAVAKPTFGHGSSSSFGFGGSSSAPLPSIESYGGPTSVPSSGFALSSELHNVTIPSGFSPARPSGTVPTFGNEFPLSYTDNSGLPPNYVVATPPDSYSLNEPSPSAAPAFYDWRTNEQLRKGREKQDKSVLAGFGPQPGTSSPSVFQLHAPHPTAPVPFSLSQPTVAHSLPAVQTFVSNTTHSTFQPTSAATLSAQPRETSTVTKLLLLIALGFKKRLLSPEEKGKLKDLVLSNNELVFSALEVFEIDQDLEEFTDTLRRVCKFT